MDQLDRPRGGGGAPPGDRARGGDRRPAREVGRAAAADRAACAGSRADEGIGARVPGGPGVEDLAAGRRRLRGRAAARADWQSPEDAAAGEVRALAPGRRHRVSMQSMRLRFAGFLLLLASIPAAAQTDAPPRVKLRDDRAAGLKLRWQLEEDVFTGSGEGSARASFTLTNQGRETIAAAGWGAHVSAVPVPPDGSVSGGFRAERVAGDLLRLAPGPGFTGLRPGQSVKIEYLTSLLTNVSFGPIGPYVVFDDTPELGRPLGEYVAAPFTRGPQGEG